MQLCSSSPARSLYSPSTLYGSTTSPESMRVAPCPRGLFFWRLDFKTGTGGGIEAGGIFWAFFYSCDRGSAWQDGSCVTQLHPARLGAPLLSGKRRGGGTQGGRKKYRSAHFSKLAFAVRSARLKSVEKLKRCQGIQNLSKRHLDARNGGKKVPGQDTKKAGSPETIPASRKGV